MTATMRPERLSALVIVLLMFAFAYFVPATHVHGQAAHHDITVTLTANEIVNISLPKEIERSAFDFDGGQFQILIPKERFPIPAPNCNKNVIFRMPGVAHEDPPKVGQIGRALGPLSVSICGQGGEEGIHPGVCGFRPIHEDKKRWHTRARVLQRLH